MTAHDLRISPKTVQQQIVEKLRAAITDGMFAPGDRLIEAELCEMLGVSRPSIREGLRSLEAERLIAIIPNCGPHIPILTPEHAAEIYQVRALLEGEAAFIAARRATADDLKAMRASLVAFGRSIRARDMPGKIASTATFYGHILRLCGNRIIQETVSALLARINFLRAHSMSQPGRAKHSLQEMKAIYQAIATKNGAAARGAAVKHVEHAHLSAIAAFETLNAQTMPRGRPRARRATAASAAISANRRPVAAKSS
ncbi:MULTISPECIES: GntR family transcriptional regulator [Rhodopseudomonas]|uniref:GntR family transcriptional regulator n=1 Tax=Rhodopseudomonas TaxID=1073 RepID=UPI0009B9416D|nr:MULTISPECIES: GntR family transcriptional regulator [Rhodopseudomonas]MDF3811415.1 GntR family transcriptional regulator [Rhodopseudomonas sp. BAL398]WOK16288.1 GntR family transcriptional regulator [Rhodopseudomonas sp. BAL398]